MDELDTYARAAARLAGLEIDEAWWPGVVLHLKVLCDNASLVEAVELAPVGPLGPLGPSTGVAAADQAAGSSTGVAAADQAAGS